MTFQDPNYADRAFKLTKCIISHYNASFFKGKRILDLGAGTGEVGAALARLGAEVIAIDAREQNLQKIREAHPHIQCIQVDLEKSFIPQDLGSFDLVLSLGIINHLFHWEKHINDLCLLTGAPHIVLETEAYDTSDSNFRIAIQENTSLDHFSFSGEGSLISAATIQSRFAKFHCKLQRKDSDILNTTYNSFKYDWAEMNSNLRDASRRRLWFIYRDPFLVKKIQARQGINAAKDGAVFNASNIKPNSICFYGDCTSDQLKHFKDVDKRYDVFVHTYNQDLVSEIKAILNPIEISTAQLEDESPLAKELFALQECNRIRNEYEQDNQCIYDSVAFRKFSSDPHIDYIMIKDYKAQISGEYCIVGNSLIGDILAMAYEYRGELAGLETKDALIKHLKNFYVPL